MILKQFGLVEGSNGMTTTGVKTDVEDDDEDGHADGIVLDAKDTDAFRASRPGQTSWT